MSDKQKSRYRNLIITFVFYVIFWIILTAIMRAIIFPEGTRSRDGKLQPFKSGGMVLAIKSGVPIVPVAILGTYKILPKGSVSLHPGNVMIRVGRPIETKNYRTNQKHDLALRLQEAIEELLSEGQD